MNELPKTPAALLEELFVIFPQYRTDYDEYGPLGDSPSTFHSILIEFTNFFGMELASFSDAQLHRFGILINDSVAQAGPLENAFDTCLLEHLHQINAKDRLIPFLSKTAREKTYS